jgi:23S rRNA (cytosine1962-C5)-methyltransferase
MLQREAAIWSDYELLDSGNFEKYERFGDVTMLRPEPQALWPMANPVTKTDVALVYSRQGKEDGDWQIVKQVPKPWTVVWEDLKFKLKTTSFKHIGLFPEQASNWKWLRENIKPEQSVLNLFGYTGGATLAAASVGAEVTHCDASKPVVTWAKENLELSGLGERKVRWIVDDAAKFVAREVRREKQYDVILMDPPAFGRGPGGELWQFEKHLPSLLSECAKILKPDQGILLVNAYSLGFPALAVENLVKSVLPRITKLDSVELTLKESQRGFELPTGVVVRAQWS